MLSVIICTYNRDKYIYNVLESIARNDYPRNDYEIVLIDNNCTDNTVPEVQRFSKEYPEVCLRYFLETEQGLSHARNRGIKEAKGGILIFVDDDATVNNQYINNYDALFQRRKDIDAAGGPIIPHYECGKEPEWMNYYLKRLLTGYLYFENKERFFPGDNYPGGGNAAYRSSVFEKTGPYNVKLGRNGNNLEGGEEKDIFNKMKNLGMSFIYTPDSILYHSIPNHKLEEDYFNRVTYNIGVSERIRTLNISKTTYLKRLIKEVVKWGGTLILWFWYTVTVNLESGNKLVKFRWNISKGLL